MAINGPSKAGSTRAAVRHSKHQRPVAVAIAAAEVCDSPAPEASGAYADLEADEDDDFAAEIAGASDAEAECEESVLQDLDPIEPDEVLDLVDAQSASESADASEDSDAELEASSSGPGFRRPSRPVCTLLPPAVNKAKPLVSNTQHAGAKQPSVLYPLRPPAWRPPVSIAYLNAAAAIASSSSGQKAADRSGVHSFPPPVFAKPPPPIALQAPAVCNTSEPTGICHDPYVSPSKIGIPPPCEPDGEDGWHWSAQPPPLCPPSPNRPTLQPPSRPISKPIHIPPRPAVLVSGPTAGPGNSGAPVAPVTTTELLRGTGTGYAALKTPVTAHQRASTAVAAGAAPTAAHAPHMAAPVARTTTPGAAAQPQCIHQQAGSQLQRPAYTRTLHAAPEHAHQQQQDAVLAAQSHAGPADRQRSHLSGPQFSPFRDTNGLQASAMAGSTCPVAAQASPTCGAAANGPSEAPTVRGEQIHAEQSPGGSPRPPPGSCGTPAAPDSSEQNAAAAADPLNDVLGEIDQFLLNQNDVCLLPDDATGLSPIPMADTKQCCTTPAPQLHDTAPLGPPGDSSVPSDSRFPGRPPVCLSLGVDVAGVDNANDDSRQEFVPRDADFQPLTPRTPRSANGANTPPDLSPADWDAVFPGISPIGGDADAAWGFDGSPSVYLSPEMSMLSPILQRALNSEAYEAVMRRDPTVFASPAALQPSDGAGEGGSGVDLARATTGSHATLTGCVEQDMQPQGGACGGRRGDGGARCGGGADGAPGCGGAGGRLWPPVARRLHLNAADGPQQEGHRPSAGPPQQDVHDLDPFTSDPFPEDAEHAGANEDRNTLNQCDGGGHQQVPLQPDSDRDELQALLDEVDAAVAAGMPPEPCPPPTLPAEQGAPHNTSSPREDEVIGGKAVCLGEQHVDHKEVTAAAICNADSDVAVDTCPDSADPAAVVQNAGETVKSGTQDSAHVSGPADRGGVLGGCATAEHAGAPADPGPEASLDAAADTDADCMDISPDCFEDLGDDDLYRLFAATCTGTLSRASHPSLPTFSELLLNDDADLDWLEAEAPDLDLDMHDVHPMHHAPPEDFPRGASPLPPGSDTEAEAAQHAAAVPLEGAGDCGAAGENAGGAAMCKDGGEGAPGGGQKRKRGQDDGGDCGDDCALTEDEEAPKMSRFERYEKRCQRAREHLQADAEGAEPPRPFMNTRSCRDPPQAVPAAAKGAEAATPESSDAAEGETSAVAAPAAEWPAAAVSSSECAPANPAACAEDAAPQQQQASAAPAATGGTGQVVLPSQLRQLYAQVQAHAQLLMQTLALTAPDGIAVTLLEDVEKQWGWPADAASSEQQKGTEHTATECWRMLTEWEQLSAELACQRPQKRVCACQVAALALPGGHAATDAQAAAEGLCESLQEGWRPVLVDGVAPCIAHVPWLDRVDELAAAFGAPRHVPDVASTEGFSSASEKSAIEIVPVGLEAATPCSSEAPPPAGQMQPGEAVLAPTRGCRKPPACPSKFMAPVKQDPDELRRVNNSKRLSRTSPYAAHVQAAFARVAVLWNRALFPRIVQASLAANDKRRKQISLCEQRLMAVCVMQHGRNYEMLSSLMPGWSAGHIKSRLHNYKRLVKPDVKEIGGAELRVALADIVNRVIDIVDGPLSKEEFDLITLALHGPTATAIAEDDEKEKFEEIAKHFVRWRTPKQINMHWTATARAVLPVLKGTPRPVQELRQLLSRSRLNGAHASVCREEDIDQEASDLSQAAPLLLHNFSAAASGGQVACEAAEEGAPARVTRGGGACRKNKKKDKVVVVPPATVVVQEEWPQAYKEDMLQHSAQLCAELGAPQDR